MNGPEKAVGPETSPEDSLILAEWVEQVKVRLEAGESVDLNDYARRDPERARRLRRLLPTIKMMADLARPTDPDLSDAGPHGPISFAGHVTLGDFRVGREVGRGGMGIVYEAEQISLRRRVALKVLPLASAVEPRQLRRFQVEAQAAAYLTHPNIVPVYAVGCERGVHYYAMQFIEGRDLAGVIREWRQADGMEAERATVPATASVRRDTAPATGAAPLPSFSPGGDLATVDDRSQSSSIGSRSEPPAAPPVVEEGAGPPSRITARDKAHFRTAAGLCVQAAEALEHAHQEGVIHRDVKPSNLLIDARGRLWVTDFGLARFQNDSTLTATGDMLGTLRYMSPEQAQARLAVVDHRTDIYSLGVTLFELLTLCPAYEGDDRRELLRRIIEEEPRPLRRLNPAVPADLETIVLKATTKDAAGRYGSARELAEDLGRFLEGRPVRARRPTLLDRAAKWSRRHRRVVAAAAGLLVLAVAGLALGAAVLASQRDDALRQSAELMLDRGLESSQNGDVGKGLLWMARGLESAPSGAVDLQDCLRSNLAGWRSQLHPLRRIFPDQRAVPGVPFSPDGKSIATVGSDGAVRLWDVATGTKRGEPLRHERTASGKPPAVNTVAFSPNGRSLVTGGSDSTARLWDADTGRPLGTPMRHKSTVYMTVFSPDGQTILTGTSLYGASLWETASGKPIGATMHDGDVPVRSERVGPDGRTQVTIRGGSTVISAAFSPDGRTILTAGSTDNAARLWDAATGRPLGTPMKHRGMVRAVAFSPDGKRILTGSRDHTARIWSTAETGDRFRGMGERSGRSTITLRHEESINAVAFSPDGKYVVTAGDDKIARIWDAATGRPMGGDLVHRGSVWAAAFSPDGKHVLTGGADGMVRLWELSPEAAIRLPLPVFPISTMVMDAAFSPDSRILATGNYDDAGRLWDGTTGRPLGQNLTRTPGGQKHSKDVRVAFSPDGTAVLVIQGKASGVWDALTGRPISPPIPLGDRVLSAAFGPDGRTIIAVGRDGTITIRQADTGRLIRTFPGQAGPLIRAVFSPDRQAVLTGGVDFRVRLCDLASGRPTTFPRAHQGEVTALAFGPDGKVVLSADSLGIARLWDAASGTPLGEPLRQEDSILAAAFTFDGKAVVTAGADKTARIWDAATGRPIGSPLEHNERVVEVGFSADGRVLATRTPSSVRTFVRLSGWAVAKPLGPIWNPRRSVTDWESDGQTFIAKFEGTRPEEVKAMALSPDGKKLLTAEDYEARLWRVASPVAGDVGRLVLWAQVLTNRELDTEGGVRGLDEREWSERRRRLDQLGGPPLP